jgi:hypothetical protein
LTTHPSWLDAERRLIVAVHTDKPHDRCRCSWEKTGKAFGRGEYWILAERQKGCPLHGASGDR